MSEEKIFDVAPGEVYEDDRSRMTIFFQVLGRKFWKLITINLMYGIFNLPALIISLFLGIYLTDMILPSSMMMDPTTQVDPLTALFALTFPLVMFLMVVPIIAVGPAQAGLTYLLRSFSYEIPTFNWLDFKDKMKENTKQGLAVTFINLFAIVFLIVDFFLYSQINSDSFLFSIANGLLIVVFLVFLMMGMYIYPMMVTYSLKLKNIYKNAFLFAFAKFLPNLGILLLTALLVLAPAIIVQLTGSVISLTIMYVYYIILGFTLPGLVINFYINPVIDKYLQPKPEETTEGQAQE